MRLLFLLLALPAFAAEEDFAFDEGYGEAVSCTVVLEQEGVKPQPDMRKNKEVKIPPDQRKRRKTTMVFSATRENGEPVLLPLLQHQAALEFWVVRGIEAKALRKSLPSEPCFVKLTGDRVLEKWYSGGFFVKGEHGRWYSFFPDKPIWIKTREEIEEIQKRLYVARDAASAAQAAGDLPEAVAQLRLARDLERDWPKDIPPGEAKTLLTLETIARLEAGPSSFPDDKAHADFLLSVAEAIPASRYDYDRNGRIRELLVSRLKEATGPLASRIEFQLVQWFRDRYKDRNADTACLDLVEMLSLVGGKGSVVAMEDYYKQKVLPGPWKDEVKERFAGYARVIRERARAQTP